MDAITRNLAKRALPGGVPLVVLVFGPTGRTLGDAGNGNGAPTLVTKL